MIAALIVLAVVAGVGWYLLGHRSSTDTAAPALGGGVSPASSAPAWSAPAPASSSSAPSASQQSSQAPVPVAPQPSTPSRYKAGNSRSRDGSAGQKPSGADESGWLSPGGARCNNGDPVEPMAETAHSRISICVNPDNNRYYYRGTYDSDAIELDDPSVSDESASITNGNVSYRLDRSSLTIIEGGTVISDEQITTWWKE